MASLALEYGVNSPEWDAQVYDAVSLASRLTAALIRMRVRVQMLNVAAKLRKMNDSLDHLFDAVHGGLRREPSGSKSQLDPASPEERVQRAIAGLMALHTILQQLCVAGHHHRLTNNSLFALQFKRMEKHDEGVLDLLDALQAYSQKEEVLKIFDRAKREVEAGEVQVLDLGQVG